MATNPIFDTLTVRGAATFASFGAPSSFASTTALNTSAPVTRVTNGATVAGLTLAFASTTGITVGMTAYGTGIPDGALVTAVASGTVTLDQTSTVTLGATVNFIGIDNLVSFTGPVAESYRLRVFDYRYAAGNTSASATRRIGFDNNANPAGFIDFNPSGTPVLGIGSGAPYASNYGFYVSASGAVTLPKGATISAPALLTVAYASGANPNGLKHVFNFSTSPIDNNANPTLFQTNITTTTNNHEIWANFDSTIHNVAGGDAATTGNIVSRYVQGIRYTASAVPLSALISNAIDATGLASASSGPLSGLEVDVTANGLDNASSRRGIEIALGKYDNGGARPESRAALEVFSGSNSVQEIGGFGFHLLANFSSPFRDAGLDFRGATAWAGAGTGTDMAIRFRSGHKVVWDTSANAVQRYNVTTGNLEVSGIGGWGSTNVGRQLVLTTPSGFSNPALGITDSTGSNIWAMINDGGTLSLARMPALTNSSTAPTNVVSIATAGTTISGGVALAGNLYDMRLSNVDMTGANDTLSALQTWLNALPKGSTARIPAEGKVLISGGDLTIPPGITIEGEGAMLETTSGIAGGLITGPAFLLTPTTTIVMSSGATLRGVKVLRSDLLAAPITSQVNTAVALWASEGVILFTSIATASGAVLTFASTTGVTVGMPVRADQLGDSVTVTGVTGTTVTLSASVLNALPAQSPIRFGRSIAVRVPRGTGGVTLEGLLIVGFHTAVLTASGRVWLRDLAADCNTILFCISGGDAGYIHSVHAIGYYGGFTSGTGNNRAGPAYVFGDATGFTVSECTQVSWLTGFVICNTSGIRFDRCWSEHNFTDGVATTTAFLTRGAVNVVTFAHCTVSAASVGFDLQHSSGNVNLVGCISAIINNGTKIGHYRFGASSVGAVTAAMINSNSATAFVVQAGVGWWRIVAPTLGTLVTSPWISGLTADLARIQTFMVRDQGGLTDGRVQTHLREKTWISWDDSIAVADGSPIEALAVESVQATSGLARIQSWLHNGTTMGFAGARGSDSVFALEATSPAKLRLAGTGGVDFYDGANPALNTSAHASSVATDYLQVGPETGGGAYVAVISPTTTAPLSLFTNAAGTLKLQVTGGATTIGGAVTITGATAITGTTTITGNASVSGVATLGSASITGTASVGGTATLAAATVTGNASVGGTATIATATVSGTATIATAAVTGNATVSGTLGVTGTTTLSGAVSAVGATTFGATVTLAGAPTLSLHAATKAYVDAAVVSGGGLADAPSNATAYGRQTGAWVAILPLTGGAVTGASTFGSTLGVTGLASLSTLNTSGLATLNSASVTTTLGVTGATTVGGALGVTGAATLSSSLSATGLATFGSNTAANAIQVSINGASTNVRQLRWNTAGVARWGMGLSSAAEGGTNTGADFAFNSYADAGTLLAQPIIISRATGQITISGGLKASGAMGFFGATPVTRPTITGAKAGNVALGGLLAALATLGLITDSTTA